MDTGEMDVEAEVSNGLTFNPFVAENYGLMHDFATRDEHVAKEMREQIRKGQGSFVFNVEGFVNCVFSGPLPRIGCRIVRIIRNSRRSLGDQRPSWFTEQTKP